MPVASTGQSTVPACSLAGTCLLISCPAIASSSWGNSVAVVRVENLVGIRPVAQLGAASGVKNARNERRRNPFTEDDDTEVSVRNGVVYLDDSVETSFEKEIAENIAFRAMGITRVRNNPVAGFPENVGDAPYVYPWSIHDDPWYETRTLSLDIIDNQTAREIRDELFRNPFFDSDDVGVSLADRVETLTGTVNSLGEYRAGRIPAAGMLTRGNGYVEKHR